ncbi:glycine cleavage system aminomethyltransferase GcvT [Microbacterium sp. 5K110]|jgi:aminomethyltransferase|uniref:glycine cleavage system aminomethyltransferase GcvT n=1 Tax=unclassified Microbacterium TaxID=2609290 RepID=UPI0010FF103F|nr:glycine cleavage system aminomethyltransferase GcvT [Microbacterium sp. 5K110]TLF32433.1 glycine cleavage system aminomethyltransferase GcvT [Microbacterium sp. 5K110]
MTDTPAPPRSSPLHDRHEALGASFTDFGGWNMPVRYSSDLAEHRAVREAAGLFDISHMAEFWVHDGRATDLLDVVLAGRASAMRTGKAKYSLVLADDGGIVDDVIVYRTGEQHYLVVANAGNREAVAGAFARVRESWPADAGEAPTVCDVTDSVALVALQGPRARGILESVGAVEILGTPLEELGYYAFTEGTFDGDSLFIARTGYTGEDGYELLVPVERAGDLWDALLAAGAPHGLVPCGLAARDTLRLEAGMPLYGHELTREIAPAQAGLGRVVATDKDAFVGKDALASRPADAPVLVGLVSDGKRAGRAGYAVLRHDEVVGEITSGALSPTLGHPVAMAYVSPTAAEPGTPLTIDVRGTRIPATVTALPFYRRNA